jgi:predicted ATP-binding protein involved in virulence
MRLDKLTLRNFRGFTEREFAFGPGFNLIVGENGSGKTTVLAAAAVALDICVQQLAFGYENRPIADSEIRRQAIRHGESLTFEAQIPSVVEATGEFLESTSLTWSSQRQFRPGQPRTSNYQQGMPYEFVSAAELMRSRVQQGEPLPLPVIACYPAGRLWIEPSNEVEPSEDAKLTLSRFEAYRDCLHGRSSKRELNRWIFKQDIKALKGNGAATTYGVMKQAILNCLPGSKDVAMDYDLTQAAVIMDDGRAVLLDDLSDGQRTTVTLVGDLARRAITLNPWMGADVLQQTEGVVLIDELDLHLHPKWQRRIVDDLKRTFPRVQFICTTHSPFLIQALQPGELIQLQPGVDAEDYAGQSLEDIVERVQGVPLPQQSHRAERLNEATARYLELLQKNGSTHADELAKAEREFREASEGFSTQPGLEAVLKLEALAAQHGIKPSAP